MAKFSGYGFVKSMNSGKGLDVPSASTVAGTPLQQWRFVAGQANQRFSFNRLDDGFYHIVVAHSRKVLDVAQASLESEARIIQWDWHGGSNQRFAVEDVDATTFLLRAKHSGKVLDVARASHDDGASIIQWDRHGGPNQQWQFTVPFD
jgi:hypothetical protein